MKRLKTFLLMLLVFQSSLLLSAQNDQLVQKLVISKSDGSEVSLLLSDKPVITFPNQSTEWEFLDHGTMTITTAANKIELKTSNLSLMKIVEVLNSGIKPIDKASTSFTLSGDALLVNVTSGTSSIAVYGSDGMMYLSKTLTYGRHILSLGNFPKCMYIVKIDGETIKIWNR